MLILNSVGASSIIISMHRTTMPAAEWEEFKRYYADSNLLFGGYQGSDDYSVTADGNTIHHVFEYRNGYDNFFYEQWKLAIDEFNMDPEQEVRFSISVEGNINPEQNPWRGVTWLPDVDVIDGNILDSPSLGRLYAENWNPEGGFWAWPYDMPDMEWLYVAGKGYYYDIVKNLYYWNPAGTSWGYQFGGHNNGGWNYLQAPPLPILDAVQDIMIDEMILQNLPGLAVGVFEGGEITHVSGVGFTDIESGSPVTPLTKFRWASISKPLTAIAALQLHESPWDFDISDLVTKHTPYWTNSTTNWASQITIDHLLTNRSGIHHYGNGRDADNDGDPDNTYTYNESLYNVADPDGYDAEKAVDVFQGTGTDFSPGSQYLYTTFGFNLLGSAVDEASPGGLVKWTEDNIADPLNMSSLKVSTGNRTGYQKSIDGRLNADTISSVEWKLPGGGWESNIIDLTRFARGVEEGTLLNIPSRQWATISGNGNYRRGINTNGSGTSFNLWHGGAHANLRTLMWVRPNQDYGVVIMCWAEYTDTWRIANRITDALGYATIAVDVTPQDDCNSTMESGDLRFAGVWRDTGDDVIVRRGYSHGAFLKEFQFLRANGYYCDDFEAHEEAGQNRWTGIFRKGSGGNPIWRNYGFDGFRDKWDEMSNQGYRLVDLETYVVNGSRKWAGLFRPGNDDYAMWRGFTTSGFATKREEMAAAGLKLIDIEPYYDNGELLWAGVWREGNDGLLNRNYNTSDFNDLIQTRRGNGWKLMDVEAYEIDGQRRWAGIWEQSNLDDRISGGGDWCSIMDNHTDWSAAGFELLDFEVFE